MEILDENILPDNAKEELKMYYSPGKDKVEVVEDPKVEGTYALQITKKDSILHLLWYDSGYDEVEFDTFPPDVGDPHFIFP